VATDLDGILLTAAECAADGSRTRIISLLESLPVKDVRISGRKPTPRWCMTADVSIRLDAVTC
jgi:hypothetical protein